jgi:hypothetical protein
LASLQKSHTKLTGTLIGIRRGEVIRLQQAVSKPRIVINLSSQRLLDIVGGQAKQAELYRAAVHDFGGALDRLATGYEADPEKRHDPRQDIHFQVWRSLEVLMDGAR